MKKLLAVATAIAGVLAYKRWQDSEAEKSVWSQSTDKVD
jgi:hypothetical protein